MPSHNVKTTITGDGSPGMAEVSLTYSGTGTGGFVDETAVGSGTNGGVTQITAAIDVSAVKSFWVKSSAALILETNSSSAADDTINLAAGEPYVWNTDSYDAFLLGTDVTAIFFTNASATACTVSAGWVYDATP